MGFPVKKQLAAATLALGLTGLSAPAFAGCDTVPASASEAAQDVWARGMEATGTRLVFEEAVTLQEPGLIMNRDVKKVELPQGSYTVKVNKKAHTVTFKGQNTCVTLTR